MAAFEDIYTYLVSNQNNIACRLRCFSELFLSGLDESIEYLEKVQQNTTNGEKNNQDLLLDYYRTLLELRNTFQEKFSISPDISLQNINDNSTQNSHSIPTTTAATTTTPGTCTLYDDIEYKKPVSFVLDNLIYPANSWKTMLVRICEILAEKDNNLFMKMTHDPQIV